MVNGEVDDARSWSWEEFRQLPQRDGHRRHPLRDEMVEARHHLDRRLGRHASRRRRDERRIRDRLVATAAIRRTCRSRICWAVRRGLPSSSTTSRSSPSTAARHGCSSRICTSGRAPSGCAGSSSSSRTSRASGRATATTTTETHGKSSATTATDLAARDGGRARRRDRADDAASCSSCRTGRAIAPASTSTCG